ncbi:LOW QUALITY PROTEIN: mitochondrial coenzyme A transporter SLC25A42 [Lepeophtheirus salmonis]|uniref:LOW QUALITY PROTEIN: mitochondrial coenzyme A transporter SLC25A42 n=1 Tax=Lepeophtheirus salmonis TaxID=72036 RepID=UPI001AEB32B3|nr:LOW QUALITY PROTEIN: mitochondrial coenzyme A transporter SLC25A42-like [Lepeophtheirus salmonis]
MLSVNKSNPSSSPEASSVEEGTSTTTTTTNHNKVQMEMVKSSVSGACAGATAKTFIAPLDRTKIYFQTHPSRNYRIKGAIKFLKLTYNETGFLSLWKGNSATMARIIPYASIQFMSHEQYKILFGLGQKNHTVPHHYHFLAGSCAGVTAQSLTYPLDRARAVMAVTKVGEYKNLLDIFKRIINEEGVFALYRGFSPTILGIIPYAGTSFFIFESLKKYWKNNNKEMGFKSDVTPLQRLFSGAIAGLLGQTASYPLDIVRRRMQTAKQMGIQCNKYSSITGTLYHVFKKEGVRRGWFKGVSMNFIKGPIATGISFSTYDFVKKLLT